MSDDTDRDAAVPESRAFLALIWGQEDDCVRKTDEYLATAGIKAPACFDEIGTALSLLDRLASCWWACHGGDHLVEYLCGRTASNGRAVLRLMRLGFYDEALLLCRSIGEIANLMTLFVSDRKSFDAWKLASRKERLREWAPGHVRGKLKDAYGEPPISDERYRLLSELAAHVHPQTTPQAYNIMHVPSAGAAFQPVGLLICLNELAVGLSLCMTFGAMLIDLKQPIRSRIMAAGKHLAEQIGDATITEIDGYYKEIRESPEFLEEIRRLSEKLIREASEVENRASAKLSSSEQKDESE
jgi:hypothetical protein